MEEEKHGGGETLLDVIMHDPNMLNIIVNLICDLIFVIDLN
jgi:hypothetical protein